MLGPDPASAQGEKAPSRLGTRSAARGAWARQFFGDLESAKTAVFCAPLGAIGSAFLEMEGEAFRMGADLCWARDAPRRASTTPSGAGFCPRAYGLRLYLRAAGDAPGWSTLIELVWIRQEL